MNKLTTFLLTDIYRVINSARIVAEKGRKKNQKKPARRIELGKLRDGVVFKSGHSVIL